MKKLSIGPSLQQNLLAYTILSYILLDLVHSQPPAEKNSKSSVDIQLAGKSEFH